MVKGKSMNDNAKKFKDWHWKIYQNYFNAKTHLEIWWLLHNKKYIKFFKINRDFFTFDAHAHLIAGTLAITKIFDPDPRSINFEQFLDFCLQNKKDIESAFPECKFCNEEISHKIKNEIDNLEDDLKAIMGWRNKTIAHDEKDFIAPPIKWERFQNIIDFLEKNILEYGSRPNQIFLKPDEILKNIEQIFNKYFKI